MSARRWPLAAAVAVTIAAATTAGLKSRTTSDQPLALSPEPSALRQAQPLISIDVHVTANGAPVDDLAQHDFELFEDKTARPIERFAHIVSGAAHPRAFVVFLDSGHLVVDDRHRLFEPLVGALDRVIAEGDLVAVMTPTMRVKDVAFAPRGASVRGVLEKFWPWGGADKAGAIHDDLEELYRTCYPPAKDKQVAVEMIERSREKTTFGALERLAGHLRDRRAPRTAILAITDGWTILKPDGGLARPVLTMGRPRTAPGNFVPGGGKPSGQDAAAGTRQPTPCDPDRLDLAQFDGKATVERLMEVANGAGASFYPIAGAALVADDSVRRSARETDSLRALARATDGVAAVTGAELDAATARIASDLKSYYVIGYRSPAAADGKAHAIDVKVARPGVDVRARRGYLLSADVLAAEATAGAEARVTRGDMDDALEPLEGLSGDAPFRLDAVSGWTPSGAAAFWVIGEVAGASAGDWLGGADADLALTDASGATVASAHLQVDPGAHSFRASLAPPTVPAPGAFDVRVKIESPGAPKPIEQTTRVALARAPSGSGVVIFRRGPTTGNKYLPTANRRFRRSDRIRVEIPVAGPVNSPAARLLDRLGAPKPVPVAASVRDDADGSRWVVAELALVPLAAGDYVIEVNGGPGARELVAFRMVP